MRRRGFSLILPLVLVAAGFAAGVVVTERIRAASAAYVTLAPRGDAPPESAPEPEQQRQRTTTTATATAPLPAPGSAPDFTRIAATTVKGVANISSYQVVRTRRSPYFDDPFFRYFFGDQDDLFGRSQRAMSLGSGVIVSADGYVVTNNHVIGENLGGVREVRVALGDKREIPGTLVGADPSTDIALLKIDVRGLPVVPWGDSSRLQVGEWVLAIGSPFSLSQTVTAGIISATGRANLGFTDYEDFIQTDAAINPGNSGGALINTRGELVGINTGIFSQSGGYQGIGFAVPSNLARHVVDDLRKFGEVRRGAIPGISAEPVSPQYAREADAPNTNGALITRMLRASEAYDAGLRPGDIIIVFNGQPISDPSQLTRLVADARIGSTATVRVWREGRTMDLKIPIVSTARDRR